MWHEAWKFIEVIAPVFLYVGILTGLIVWAIIDATKDDKNAQ
jgi:hypothetical protein